MKNNTLHIKGTEITIFYQNNEDYVSLTDISKGFVKSEEDQRNSEYFILNWLRLGNTVEFLGAWEQLHNTGFNPVGYDRIKINLTSNAFRLSAKKWIEETNAVGIISRSGRYGGTYAHKDIAIQFCYWLSPTFQIYLIKEFQRIQEERRDNLQWDIRRMLTKVNYHIHSDAVRQNLVPLVNWNTKKEGIYFASEADVLNVAVFGMTASEWRLSNPETQGNLRDNATHEQLIILANLEAINAELIRDGMKQDERVLKLNEIAVYQMQILNNLPTLKNLPNKRD
jgi:KilA-N domain